MSRGLVRCFLVVRTVVGELRDPWDEGYLALTDGVLAVMGEEEGEGGAEGK